jgi:hypothetical protein
MPEPDIVKTGIAGLDEILTGGIPRGNVILVEGAIGGSLAHLIYPPGVRQNHDGRRVHLPGSKRIW